MTTTSNEDWSRLGAVIARRIDDLRLTRSDVQERGGPSPATVRAIINGRSRTLSVSKRRDLERALNWLPGSVDDVLAGGDPRIVRADRVGIAVRQKVDRKEEEERLALALAVAVDEAEDATNRIEGVYWDESEPEFFDGDEFEAAQSDVVYAVGQLIALATEMAERVYGGKAQLAIAKEREREKQHRRYQIINEALQRQRLAAGEGKVEDLRQDQLALAALEIDEPKGPDPRGLDDGEE